MQINVVHFGGYDKAKVIPVRLVGTSSYSDFMHLPALKSHSQAELAAICGRDRDRLQEMASKYGLPQVYSDYQQIIDMARWCVGEILKVSAYLPSFIKGPGVEGGCWT